MASLPRTVPAYLAAVAARHPDRIALDDGQTTVSFAVLVDSAARLAEAFRRAGVKSGDRVGFHADNDRRWILTDLALQLIGAVSVPRGTDTPTAEMAGFLEHAGAAVAVVHGPRQAERMREALPAMRILATFTPTDDDTPSIDDLVASVPTAASFAEQAQAIAPDMLATIIYTSGTTGRPKGVLLAQSNFGHQLASCPVALEIDEEERFLSILPPWHIFERTVEYIALSRGCRLVYTDRRRLREDMVRHRPTFFPSVPRIWETVYDGILKAVQGGSPVRRGIFRVAVATGSFHATHWDRARGLNLRMSRPRGLAVVADAGLRATSAFAATLAWPVSRLGDVLVFRKLRAVTGGALKAAISGGGLMPPHVDRFFRAIGIPLYVGYGLTETSPVLAVRRPGHNVLGTIGRIVGEVEIDVRDPETHASLPRGREGVIWTRGPQVMQGYYADAELTRAAIDPAGWFNTGDLGVFTESGDLCFRGRIKETIVLKGGENVEPSAIESLLLASPQIEQAIVVGQDRKHLAALLVPAMDAFAGRRVPGSSEVEFRAALAADAEVEAALRREALARTSHLPGFRRVTRIVLLPEALTAENGLLTQTLKPRRHVIVERLGAVIEKAYDS